MAHKYDTSDFRNGLKILVDRAPYQMVYFQFVKPGRAPRSPGPSSRT